MGIDGSEIKKNVNDLDNKKKTAQINLSTCATCQRDISRNADICPHCGEPQRNSLEQNEHSSIDKHYKIYGITGSALLAVGVFCPVFSIPISGDINMFRNGEGDGVAILIFAVLSVLFMFIGKAKYLWYSGIGTLILLGFTFYEFRQRIDSIKADMHQNLAGNPFSGLADMAINSVSMQWGWGVLLVGCGLILASAYCRPQD